MLHYVTRKNTIQHQLTHKDEGRCYYIVWPDAVDHCRYEQHFAATLSIGFDRIPEDVAHHGDLHPSLGQAHQRRTMNGDQGLQHEDFVYWCITLHGLHLHSLVHSSFFVSEVQIDYQQN